MQSTYDEQIARFHTEVADEIAALRIRLPLAMKESRERIRAASATVAAQVSQLDDRIAKLRVEKGFFKRLRSYFQIKSVTRTKKTLNTGLQKRTKSEEQFLSNLQRELTYKETNKAKLVAERKSQLDLSISRLTEAAASREFAGALGEAEVAEILSKLPPECCVFHDVRLEADHFLRFDGTPLQSAQADHIVLTPAGVFVIEVKNWSGAFVDGNNYFDPYKQAARARFLCQVILRDRGQGTKVRSILVTRGKLPPKPEDTYVKVLEPCQLLGYISWFKPVPAQVPDLNHIRCTLEAMVADSACQSRQSTQRHGRESRNRRGPSY